MPGELVDLRLPEGGGDAVVGDGHVEALGHPVFVDYLNDNMTALASGLLIVEISGDEIVLRPGETVVILSFERRRTKRR